MNGISRASKWPGNNSKIEEREFEEKSKEH